jgi:putative inorganic carbon (HCO3(-)) transporter
MSHFMYNLRDRKDNDLFFSSPYKWLRKQILEEKLLNPFGYFLLSGIALFIAMVAGYLGIKAVSGLIGAVVGIPVISGVIFNVRFGLLFLVIFEFFLGMIYRLVSGITWGVVLDVLICLLLFGVFIQQISKRDWSFLKSPISIWVLVWILYNIAQVANPVAASRLAWVFSVRAMGLMYLLYFVAMYALSSLRYITNVFKVIIFLSLLGALYGLFQEYVFYPQYDLDSFIHDPRSYQLMFQGGKFRKLSVFGDPVMFGVSMAYMSILCLILSHGPFKRYQKIFLRIICVLCLFSMSFSGTRTAYVLVPIGLVFYVLLTHKKNLLIGLCVFMVFGAGLVIMPTGNATLYRFQSAFRPNNDASFQVRVVNQRLIKPYILSHPFGGGLGSVGEFGKRFSPGTFLANFPPDSGFVRIAVEQGWIGLIIYFTLLFTVLKEGINHYFRCVDPRIKIYYAGVLTSIYVLCIASYPQEVIPLYPISAIFCVAMALVAKLKDFDPAYA